VGATSVACVEAKTTMSRGYRTVLGIRGFAARRGGKTKKVDRKRESKGLGTPREERGGGGATS